MDETPQDEEIVSQEIVSFVRDRSRQGQLTSREELLQHLIDGKKLPVNPEEQTTAFESAFRKASDKNQDLQEVVDPNGAVYYFSSQCMTQAYVSILLRKKGDPLVLIAEIVRENSAVYPRPIPLGTFKDSPFDMTDDEIKTCLEEMAAQAEYKDICQTTTSIGTVFLYSTAHLEPDHASMLAEWFDVGQYKSP